MEILKLQPIFKDYIWGGQRLREDFGFQSDLPKLAEGWMLACHQAGMNTIDGGSYDGQPLEQVVESVGKEALCGTNAARFPYFPVLIKLMPRTTCLFKCTRITTMPAVWRTNPARQRCGMCWTQPPAPS